MAFDTFLYLIFGVFGSLWLLGLLFEATDDIFSPISDKKEEIENIEKILKESKKLLKKANKSN